MSRQPIISVKNIKKYYKLPKDSLFQRGRNEIKAVDDVSFDVYPGETLGIVGESGSGKSTIARLVNRLITPTEGTIKYNGKDITNQSKADLVPLRRKMQMVFQSPYGTLDSRRTIEYSLMEPFVIHQIGDQKMRQERIRELLDLVGLPYSSLSKYPHEFSGGQLQRINIARAIALNPEVVICDESVSALDVSVQAQILNLLNDLQEKMNLTYIFISHDLNVIRYFCDRIAVMSQGKLVEIGESEDIYLNSKEEYTLKLIEAIPTSSPYKN